MRDLDVSLARCALGIALALGCSSSDDVIGVLEAQAPPQAAIQVFNVSAGQAPGTALVHPAPPPILEDSVFVSGVPLEGEASDAERWPLEPPLESFFHPASLTGDAVVVEVAGLAAHALRGLGVAYGLAPGGAAANVVVQDRTGARYDISIWELE
jgi:hypothetical protein